MTHKTVTLAHGNGGRLTHDLVSRVFVPRFAPCDSRDSDTELRDLSDGAVLSLPEKAAGKLVFTTDSHVVTPLFFPGGDIGKLAVNGTLNDLAVMGATPLYLSCGWIIEEGFEIEKIEKIADSMAEEARRNGVRIVTGDTKVVESGAADGLYINTAGIGLQMERAPRGVQGIREGDVVLLSGSIGDHGIAIYAGREGISLQTELRSDCAAVFPLVQRALEVCPEVRVMRDPTRGGLATTLNEFVNGSSFGIEIREGDIPVKPEVRGVCELLGFDPLFVANEGKLVLVVPAEASARVLAALRSHELGKAAAQIGKVSLRQPGRVTLKTTVGGERYLDMLMGDMLPRIC